MADPRFRGIEDLRIAMYRRHERADIDLRIPESADEDPRRRRSVHLHPVDHRGGLHHEVPAHENRAARFAAEELRPAALDAQTARDRRLRVRVEDRRELSGAGWTGRESIATPPTERGLMNVATGWAKRPRE